MNGMEAQYLRRQYSLGRWSFMITAPLVLLAIALAGYRVRDLRRTRHRIQSLLNDHPGPWLICANHLTMIDSVFLAYAMAPLFSYLTHFKQLPWNVPEQTNFNRNRLTTLLCYLLKCVPVIRGGDRDQIKAFLDKCAWLLRNGHPLMIFPEGTRSRTGRVDPSRVSYGVGRLVAAAPGCRVLCLYLRGEGQNHYSNLPRFGETFTVASRVCRPRTPLKGLRGHRERARQIADCLADMEDRYFATRRK